ncbi:MAG TPA: hypothetical protein ENK23_06665 [Sorangium sp.]|nr:hypothetical protein [Sorangium sp.]
MLLRIAQLVGLAITVVLLTRLVVRGIELHAEAGAMSSKAKGQFLGYATSIPELAGTVGTAGHGLLTAGLWNIASSNVINWALFLLAAVCYRRTGALLKRRFRDEIGFAVVAVAIPLVLSRQRAIAGSPWTALALFGLFVGYVYLDRHLNPNPPPQRGRLAPPWQKEKSWPGATLYHKRCHRHRGDGAFFGGNRQVCGGRFGGTAMGGWLDTWGYYLIAGNGRLLRGVCHSESPSLARRRRLPRKPG